MLQNEKYFTEMPNSNLDSVTNKLSQLEKSNNSDFSSARETRFNQKDTSNSSASEGNNSYSESLNSRDRVESSDSAKVGRGTP